jgi:hypothetical protein
MKIVKILLLIIYFIPGVLAQDSFFRKTEEQILESRRKSTLKITFEYNGNRKISTGFFIHKKGLLVTSSHLLKKAGYPHYSPENKSDYKLIISSRHGQMERIYAGGKFIKCFDQKEIDICLLTVGKPKGKMKVKNYAPLKRERRKVPKNKFAKTPIYMIGHCSGRHYVKSGSIVRYYEDFQNTEVVLLMGSIGKLMFSFETDKEPCEKDSGGPIFDRRTGKVLGVVQEMAREQGKQERFFLALASYEIEKVLRPYIRDYQ